MESIGRMAGGIAHDFRNLLTPILVGADLGRKNLPAEHPVRSHFEVIIQAAERANDLTTRLLAFSRREDAEPRLINLNDLLRETEQMVSGIIARDVELKISPCPDLDLVEVDPGQMQQILVNLVVNAVDAMPNGGYLEIKAENRWLEEESAQLQPSLTAAPYVLISVSDSGEGMTEEVKAHLFEPFFTTKEAGKGTGLGLATCYGIITQSGGHIEVESKLGKGTTFEIYLPSAREAPPEMPSRVQENYENPGASSESILLAEDEPLVRTLMAQVLRDQGYQVWEAENGEEALELFQTMEQESVDILLTDVVMPHMGGIELAQRITELRPNIPVLFASGYSPEPLFTTGDSSRELRFIQKPFLPDALASKVREVLDSEPAKAEV